MRGAERGQEGCKRDDHARPTGSHSEAGKFRESNGTDERTALIAVAFGSYTDTASLSERFAPWPQTVFARLRKYGVGDKINSVAHGKHFNRCSDVILV